jgi:hypothetical protein
VLCVIRYTGATPSATTVTTATTPVAPTTTTTAAMDQMMAAATAGTAPTTNTTAAPTAAVAMSPEDLRRLCSAQSVDYDLVRDMIETEHLAPTQAVAVIKRMANRLPGGGGAAGGSSGAGKDGSGGGGGVLPLAIPSNPATPAVPVPSSVLSHYLAMCVCSLSLSLSLSLYYLSIYLSIYLSFVLVCYVPVSNICVNFTLLLFAFPSLVFVFSSFLIRCSISPHQR